MIELFKWLTTNPIAGMVASITFGILILSIVVVFLVAFFQGREITFWPPKIGARYGEPIQKKDNKPIQSDNQPSTNRDISGTWETSWIFTNENGEELITKAINYIKMTGNDSFEGEGKNEDKKWHYSLIGTIDEMGYLSGTWRSLVDTYKGSFLLKLRPSMKRIEGHTLSVAFEKDTRAGKWIWELKQR